MDCIDVSADIAVVKAASDGITAGVKSSKDNIERPLLMISVNDDEDPHFRKAYFDINKCPPDCTRPCELSCPAYAIPSLSTLTNKNNGIITDKCYGCGRCVLTCPLGIIDTKSYQVDSNVITDLLSQQLVDAIEIHTQYQHDAYFNELFSKIGDSGNCFTHLILLTDAHILAYLVLSNSKVLAVSFPDMDANTLPYLEKLQHIITTHQSYNKFNGVQIWQTDGRPMSGDIGKGTVHASTALASKLIKSSSNLINLHTQKQFLQLAGGTNDYSIEIVKREGLAGMTGFGGYAFGGYARKVISNYLNELDSRVPGALIEEHPEVLEKCNLFASNLVNIVKTG